METRALTSRQAAEGHERELSQIKPVCNSSKYCYLQPALDKAFMERSKASGIFSGLFNPALWIREDEKNSLPSHSKLLQSNGMMQQMLLRLQDPWNPLQEFCSNITVCKS